MDVPLPYCIIDARKPSELKTYTISHYKRVDVIKDFHNSIIEGNLERACLWTAELHSSGKADLIWKELLEEVPGYINKKNPHISTWIWHKFHIYEYLLTTFTPKYRYEHRNNQEIRNLLVDVVAVITTSDKFHISEIIPKIGKAHLQIENYKRKMISSHLRLIENIVNTYDPSEIQIGINEIVTLLGSTNFKLENVLYWYMWLNLMEKSKKKWEVFICFPHQDEKENPSDVDDKLHGDWVWAFWRGIRQESHQRATMVQDAIAALYQMYQWKFTKTAKKRKRHIIFAACSLLCDDVKWNTKIIQNVALRIQACSNSNILYKMIDEKIDANRQVSRTEYYTFIQPLVEKNNTKKSAKNAKVELQNEHKQIKRNIKTGYLTGLITHYKPTQTVIENMRDNPEIKIVKIGHK